MGKFPVEHSFPLLNNATAVRQAFDKVSMFQRKLRAKIGDLIQNILLHFTAKLV